MSTNLSIARTYACNPIGSTDSAAFKGFFVASLCVVLLMGARPARWPRVDVRKE
jgi:hypothetical protein